MQEQISALSEQDIEDNFNGFLIGVDGETLTKYRDRLGSPIDIEAFDRGEIALIATDNPELFSNVQELNITPSYREENSVSKSKFIFLLIGNAIFFPIRRRDIQLLNIGK